MPLRTVRLTPGVFVATYAGSLNVSGWSADFLPIFAGSPSIYRKGGAYYRTRRDALLSRDPIMLG